MRLWSLHPSHLDVRGLTALWREGLLAQKVLEGRTRGYRSHPQLERFRRARLPLSALAAYLLAVWKEAHDRGYHFDRAKVRHRPGRAKLPCTTGQIAYERLHLLRKLRTRDRKAWRRLAKAERPAVHPLFRVRTGPVEPWERAPVLGISSEF